MVGSRVIESVINLQAVRPRLVSPVEDRPDLLAVPEPRLGPGATAGCAPVRASGPALNPQHSRRSTSLPNYLLIAVRPTPCLKTSVIVREEAMFHSHRRGLASSQSAPPSVSAPAWQERAGKPDATRTVFHPPGRLERTLTKGAIARTKRQKKSEGRIEEGYSSV